MKTTIKRKMHSGGVRHPKAQCKISLTLPADMLERVQEEASKTAMPVATWVRVAVVERLQTGVSDTSVSPAAV